MTQRFEGHTLEEALAAAAETLGAERDQITHRVLVEKRGFLGGVKRVVIEAEVNENAAPSSVAAGFSPPAESGGLESAPSPESGTAAPPPRESRGGGRSRGPRGSGG